MDYDTSCDGMRCLCVYGGFVDASNHQEGPAEDVLPAPIIGANLPTIQDLYTSRVSKRAGKITADPSHPPDTTYSNSSPLVNATDHCLPKPPGIKTVSFPLAVSLLNS